MKRPAAVPPIEIGPVPGVVALLRDVLARAEAGEVRGVAIAAAHTGRCTAGSFASGDSTIADLYLAIGRVQLLLLEEP